MFMKFKIGYKFIIIQNGKIYSEKHSRSILVQYGCELEFKYRY